LRNVGDSRCFTPFHVACAGGHVACARLLCEAGADTQLLSDTGLTGWQLAEQLHRSEIVQLHPEFGAQGTP
jgi:ankyrin repeat protein